MADERDDRIRDDRREDRGRSSRRISAREWLQIAGLGMAIATMVWQGGRMTEKLDAVAAEVTVIRSAVAEIPVLKTRVDQHDKEITHHERRLVRIEARRE